MIPRLPGWSWELRHDGVVTAPPEGKGAGFVRYRERERPLRRPRELAQELERDRRFRITSVGKPERLVTAEGEYGAVLTVDGLLLEAPVQHTMAFVFLDDFYSVIDGLAMTPEHHGRFAREVRTLALYDGHGLSEHRRRRFLYEPPPGWTGVANFLHSYWFPVDYPKNRSSFTILPALPVAPGSHFSEEIAEQQAAQSPGFELDSKSEARPHVTRKGLSGSFWEILGRVGGALCFRDLVVLDDGRFAHTVILESPRDKRDENTRLLRALLDTIEPIPRAGATIAEGSKESMNHWAE